MKFATKRALRGGVALAVVLVALLVLVGGPGYARHGKWDRGDTRIYDTCDDVLRGPGSATANATADPASGTMTGSAGAGVGAFGTDPPIGVIIHPQTPLPSLLCVGIGGSKAVGDGILRSVIKWPGNAAAHQVSVKFTGISVTGQQLGPSFPQTVGIPVVGPLIGADRGWHVLAGIQVTYYPCEITSTIGADPTPPPCAAATPVLQDVEDILRSTAPGATPPVNGAQPDVTVCVSDFLSAVATLPGSLVVDASLNNFAVAHGDGTATVNSVATAGSPATSIADCPSAPFESGTDGDSEF